MLQVSEVGPTMLTTTSVELRAPATVIVMVLPSSLTKVNVRDPEASSGSCSGSALGAFRVRLGDRAPSLCSGWHCLRFALIRPAAVRHMTCRPAKEMCSWSNRGEMVRSNVKVGLYLIAQVNKSAVQVDGLFD